MQPFIIVSKPRSGTNHLVQLLDSHPDIACYGEIFRAEYRMTKLIDPSLEPFADLSARAADPGAYLDRIADLRAADARFLGFKVFPNQMSAMEKLFSREGILFVRLGRRNLLATFSSNKIARETGQGVARAGEEVKKTRISFEDKEFANYLKRQAQQDARTGDLMAGVPGERIFDLDYGDLADADRLDALQAFLGAEPRPLSSNMQKRNPSDILARFDNPDAVQRYLAAQGLEAWASE